MLRFCKMVLKKHGSTPKNVKKRQKTAFLGLWDPSADPKNSVFGLRGGVPALFFAVFCQKTGLGPLQKRQKQRFWAFFERFWAFFDQFLTFLKPRDRVRPARTGPPRAGPEGLFLMFLKPCINLLLFLLKYWLFFYIFIKFCIIFYIFAIIFIICW